MMEELLDLFNKKGSTENHKDNFKKSVYEFIRKKVYKLNHETFKKTLSTEDKSILFSKFFKECLSFVIHNLVSKHVDVKVICLYDKDESLLKEGLLKGTAGWSFSGIDYLCYMVIIDYNKGKLKSSSSINFNSSITFNIETMPGCCGALQIYDFNWYNIDHNKKTTEILIASFQSICKYIFLNRHIFINHVTNDDRLLVASKFLGVQGVHYGTNPKSGKELFTLTLKRSDVC